MAKKVRIAEVKISEFSKEGLGRGILARADGTSQLVDVPFSAPGDEATVALLKRKRGAYTSKVVEWTHFSQKRIAPRCCHFGSCGGCRWQHISYGEQLKQKENWIYEKLKPHLSSSVDCHPIIPCSPPWQYRNKMELTFSSDKAGNQYLGLILFGTRGHVFQMKECHLANPWMLDAVHAVSKWWEKSSLLAYHTGYDSGSLRTLTLREGMRTGDRMAILTVSGNPSYALNQNNLKEFVDALKIVLEPTIPSGGALSIFLRIQQIAKGKRTQFFEMLLDGPDHIRETIKIDTGDGAHIFKFQISPSAFFQPNTRQAEILYSRVVQMMNAPNDSIVYDLYCGTGTLGICLARNAKQVIGIELSSESVCDARENIKHNQLSNVSLLEGDVGLVLGQLQEDKSRSPDVVVVDPPRAGLDPKAIHHILELKAPILTYVSCNPATQAENIEPLVRNGYRLTAVQPVDQFPHTPHVENIAVLIRS